jgi:hypothetical protein
MMRRNAASTAMVAWPLKVKNGVQSVFFDVFLGKHATANLTLGNTLISAVSSVKQLAVWLEGQQQTGTSSSKESCTYACCCQDSRIPYSFCS